MNSLSTDSQRADIRIDPHTAAPPGKADMSASLYTISPPSGITPGAFDLKACRSLMRGGSKTFFAASLLLPPRIRLAATALYAFCRVADDLIDDGEDKTMAFTELKQRLDAVYLAQPHQLESDLALSLVVHQHGIPRALLDALLDGFLWDAQERRYDGIQELHAYAARVASTVGVMMSILMGVRGAPALARACDLGVAMQLTNIARDVGEDARAGRLYLPRAWMREEGLDPDRWLRTPTHNPSLARVVARLLQEADRLYARADAGIALLPRDCQGAIRAAALIYAEIGRELERNGCNSVDSRTVVSSRRKFVLLGKALTWPRKVRPADEAWDDCLPAAAFLVEAAAVAAPGVHANGSSGQSPADSPVAWLIDLFERREIERRRRNGLRGNTGAVEPTAGG